MFDVVEDPQVREFMCKIQASIDWYIANRNRDGSSKDAVVQSVTDTDGQKRLSVQSAQPFNAFLVELKAWVSYEREGMENALETDDLHSASNRKKRIKLLSEVVAMAEKHLNK